MLTFKLFRNYNSNRFDTLSQHYWNINLNRNVFQNSNHYNRRLLRIGFLLYWSIVRHSTDLKFFKLSTKIYVQKLRGEPVKYIFEISVIYQKLKRERFETPLWRRIVYTSGSQSIWTAVPFYGWNSVAAPSCRNQRENLNSKRLF